MVGDSGSWMAGGTIVGSELGAPSSGLRCLRVEELCSAEVVVEDILSSISSDGSMAIFGAGPRAASAFSRSSRSRSDAFVSLPSVMAAGFPTLCHGNHSHGGGRRMTKTTDATMSEMPSRAMLGCAETRNGSRNEEIPDVDAKQSKDDGKGMHVVSKFGTSGGLVVCRSQWGPFITATGTSLAGGQARGATPGWA